MAIKPPPHKPLEHAEKDELAERGGDAAENRGDRESDDGGDVVLTAPHQLLQPGREWDDDDGGDDVAGNDPGALVEVGADVTLNRGQRDVDDGRRRALGAAWRP